MTLAQGGPSHPLDLPEHCENTFCIAPACHVERCTRKPWARCRGFCNDCVARFYIGFRHMTPEC
uniref:Uncharacterized protein n=1 Tax=Magallana gigas TaxID=29159 RepID=A0A8W8NRK4_MAGGI